jgi:hypothetical protein
MSEFKSLSNTRSYRVSYTAYAGRYGEFEIQGKNCRILSHYDLAGTEIAEEIAEYIQQTDRLFVSHVVIHRIA